MSTTEGESMEASAGYALHEDAGAAAGTPTHRTSGLAPQSPLLQRHARASANANSSGYQPPTAPGVKAVNMPPQVTSRIMDRDPVFQRSRGRWNIRRKKVENYWKLYLQDPFHTLVNMRLSKVLGCLAFCYLAALIVFGALYTTVPTDTCASAIYTYFDGFSFSVSVFFTIGFGTNGGDVFFGDCVWMQVIITAESLVAVLLDAIAIGLIFERIARAQARANTIVLSKNAIVRRIRGNLYFMFQVCEMRKHQLVEAHVRMYAIRHDVDFGRPYYFQSYPMRIQHPDDELGGMLLLALPSVVVHRLDDWSPLMRPKHSALCGYHHNPAVNYLFPNALSRMTDAEDGTRDAAVPLDPARSRIANPCRCEHAEEKTGPNGEEMSHQAMIDDMQSYWRESQLEVVVLLEGIDAVTSATIQVRHSYTVDEILFDHIFENCVDVDPLTGGAVIDFKRFHDTQRVDPDCVKVSGAFY